jgi:hypothetical protein
VSWLFVAFIPGLLMLATLGLERLESRLNTDTLMATEVAVFLEQAQPDDVHTLAREGMPEALDCFHRRRMERIEPSMEAVIEATNNGGSFARMRAHHRPNPQFQPTRHADPV